MLQTLHIENVALIDHLEISFSDGFHVLTGETGAGKSILIDAVNFILGERASREIIQSGAERAYVEAAFQCDTCPNVLNKLDENGIPYDAGDLLIISRTLTQAGKNTVRINGTLANLATLKSITDLLVDVHGQHEHQSLLYADSHIAYLDAMGDDAFQALKASVQDTYQQLHTAEKALLFGFPSEQERARRLDLLEYQIQEIELASLVDGEDEELNARLRVLSNAQEIREALSQAYESLQGDEGAFTLLGVSLKSMEHIAAYHEDYAEIHERMQEAYYMIEDVARSIRESESKAEFDPAELQQVEERVGLIQALKRKYGNTIAEILAFLDQAVTEREQLQQNEQRREQLMQEVQRCQQAYDALAGRLTDFRKLLAGELQKKLLRQLQDLGMPHAQFEARITPLPSPASLGLDAIEFYLSANQGEPLKPLQRVASGGELSRIMLAFKTIRFGTIPTIIFDEIDSGISGHIATSVGQKMMEIAQGHQVLCVTHLVQIAAMADTHFYVEKIEQDGRTYSVFHELNYTERITELSRIMGADYTDIQAQKHAEELLQRNYVLKSKS